MVRTQYWFAGPEHGHRDFEPADGDYFVFTENADSLSSEVMLGPDEEPVDMSHLMAKEYVRFRTSGISVLDFLDMMYRFDPLDHDEARDGVQGEQRRQRRSQLRENLKDVPLPLLDLYVPKDHSERPLIAATLTPGSWHLMGVRQRRREDSRLPVFVGAPELPPGPYLPGSLDVLAAVPPDMLYRLRDIFSLVHVPDAGITGPGGGAPGPPPDAPRRGGEDWEPETKAPAKPTETTRAAMASKAAKFRLGRRNSPAGGDRAPEKL